LYETDVGIQGDYFLLPGAAGKGMCRICESAGNKFFEVWQEIMENSGPIQPVADERMQHLMSPGLNPPINSREGRYVRYMRPNESSVCS
jgi:hypothetical protein